MNFEVGGDTLYITDSTIATQRKEQQKVLAKYQCTANGELTLSDIKVWYWDYGTSDWTEGDASDLNILPLNANIELLDNGAVMMVRYEEPSYDTENPAPIQRWHLFYNMDKTVTSDINAVQGRWHWIMHNPEAEDAIRTAITIDGNNFDLIITAWNERYIGTLTYENGVLNLNITGYSHVDQEQLTDDNRFLIMEDPYSDEIPWVAEPAYYQTMSLVFFVYNSRTAYGNIANLEAEYTKQFIAK